MAHGKWWLTAEDVNNDVVEMTGVPFGLNNNFIISGQRPPPPRNEYDECDEEMLLRYGYSGRGSHAASDNFSIEGPDCAGITQCIRMAQASDTQRSRKTQKPVEQQIVISKLNPEVKEFQKPVEQQIVISKLNPEVKEFVPRYSQCAVTAKPETSKKFIEEKTQSSKSQVPINASETSVKINNGVTNCTNQNNGVNIEDSRETLKQTEVIAKLKEKIISIPKEKRKDKNAAIAALIRASCVPSPKPNVPSSSSEMPKLLTPDYFALTNTNKDSPQTPSPELKPNPIVTQEDEEPEVLPPKLEVTDDLPKSPDPYVQDSIEKVNNWFQGPTTQLPQPKPKPIPFMGTITYKKKNVPKMCEKSENASSSPNTSPSKSPVNTTPAYVPSKYAEDLLKKYEEREKEKIKHLNIWDKLEYDLKKKDEDIRNRIRNGEAQRNNNDNITRSTR